MAGLAAAEIETLGPGSYPDKEGLILEIGQGRVWNFTRSFLWSSRGRSYSATVTFVLGSFPLVDLRAARKQAEFLGSITKDFKFNRSTLEKIPPVKVGEFWFNDTEVKGLRLRVGRTVKAFVLEKRVKNGPKSAKKFTLGEFDPGNKNMLKDVRDRAREYILACDRGKEPGPQKKNQKPVITLQRATEYYFDTAKLAKNTLIAHKGYVRNYLGHWINRDLSTITTEEMVSYYLRANNQGQAYQACQLFGRIFKAAKRYFLHDGAKILGRNPWTEAREECDYEKPDNDQPFIPAYKVGEYIHTVLNPPNNLHGTVGRYECYYLALYTGLRINELLKLKWEDVNLKEGFLTVVRERSKNKKPHYVPFSTPVKKFFTAKHKRRTQGPYVWPSKRSTAKPIPQYHGDCAKIIDAIGIPWSPHACRRTFATIADEIGLTEARVSTMLNHTKKRSGKTVTQQYINRAFNPTKTREDFQAVANYLDAKLQEFEQA